MRELWKDIPGYEGIYEASNTGKIRTSTNKVTHNSKGIRHWKQRELKFKCNYKNDFIGYRVSLWKDGKCKDYLVHRLVAATFIENNLDSDLTINHKDGNRANNNVNNLEWCTRAENIKKGFADGLFPTKRITLINTKSNCGITFNSLAQASEFFGLNKNYFSQFIKKKNSNKYFLFNENFYLIQVEG